MVRIVENLRLRRRITRSNTELVKAALDQLEAVGVEWAPRFVEVEAGEEVLSWLPGEALESWAQEHERLERLAVIVRQLHDSTATLAKVSECLVHDDLQPRNVVVEGEFIGLIDWEQLRPGRRVEDVAQLCWSFAGPSPGDTVDSVAQRWRRILDAYGLTDRDEVVPVALAKIRRCVRDIVREADQGSVRPQALRDRGDHHDLDAILAWLARNQDGLAAAIAERRHAGWR